MRGFFPANISPGDSCICPNVLRKTGNESRSSTKSQWCAFLPVALLPISRSGHSRQSARRSKLIGRGTIYFSQMTQTAEGTAHCIETPCYTMKAWPVTPDLRLVTLLSVNHCWLPYCQWITTSECASASGCWGCVYFPSLWAHWALCHPVLLYHNAGWNLLRPNPQS